MGVRVWHKRVNDPMRGHLAIYLYIHAIILGGARRMEAGLCDVYVRVRASTNKHACMSVCMYGETRMHKTYVRRRHVYIQTHGGHVCRSLACVLPSYVGVHDN